MQASPSSLEPTDLESFLTAPVEIVRAVAPSTVVTLQGGTRRRVVLEGMNPHSLEYAEWTFRQMKESAALLFHLGVKTVFCGYLTPDNLRERGSYEKVVQLGEKVFASEEALQDCRRRGWKIRLFGVETLPEQFHASFGRIQSALKSVEPSGDAPTFWLYCNGQYGGFWSLLVDAFKRTVSTSREAVQKTIYGDDFKAAELFLSFGKPLMDEDMIPPLVLAPRAHCYWDQKPGYRTAERDIRKILYDFAFLRKTWIADKSTRYSTMLGNQLIWEQNLVLGMGTRLGGFWYQDTSGIQNSQEPKNEECHKE